MTKIFEVRIAMYAVVAADNENHAYEVARRNASSILSDDGNPYIDVLCEAKTLQDLGHGWMEWRLFAVWRRWQNDIVKIVEI